MPPKPSLPDEDFDSRHERQVALETRVHGLLHHDKVKQAQREFAAGWQETTLAHLPQRYAFRVQHSDADGVGRLIGLLQAGDDVSFELHPGMDPHRPDMTGVTLAGGRWPIGFLPDDAVEVLDRAGDQASLYEVVFLHLAPAPQGGGLVIDLELVRPALRTCVACGNDHYGSDDKCEKCLDEGRRKRRGASGGAERGNVPLQRAFRDITTHEAAAD